MLSGLFVLDNSPKSRTATWRSRLSVGDHRDFNGGSGSHNWARGVLAAMGAWRRKPGVTWHSLRDEKRQPCSENTIFCKHLRNGTTGWELKSQATIKDSLIVRIEGKRRPRHHEIHTDLDAIMSVVYRINPTSSTRICHSACAPYACIGSLCLLKSFVWLRRASRSSSRSPIARNCRALARMSRSNRYRSGFNSLAVMLAHLHVLPVYLQGGSNDLPAEVFV